MRLLAEDPQSAGRLGRAARQRIQSQFSMEQSISHLWSIMEASVDGSKNKVTQDLAAL
jgi:hypothetical protein